MITGRQLAEMFAARQYAQMLEVLAAVEGNATHSTPDESLELIWFKARALHRLDRLDDAIDLFEGMVAQGAWDGTRLGAILRNELAECYRESGQSPTRARQLYLEVLELDPGNPVVLNNLGLLEQAEDHFEKAVKYFRAAREIECQGDQPSEVEAAITMDNLAGALLDLANASRDEAAGGWIAEAIQLLEAARAVFQQAGEEELAAGNAIYLGRALRDVGELSKASELISGELAACEARPFLHGRATELRDVAGEILVAKGRNGEARALYTAQLEVVGASHLRARTLAALASIAVAEGNWRTALELNEKRLAGLADRVVNEAKLSTYDDRLALFDTADAAVGSMLAITAEANEADLIEHTLSALVRWRGAYIEIERILLAAARTAGADVRAAWEDVQRSRRLLIEHLLGDPGPEITVHMRTSRRLNMELAKAHGRFVERFVRDQACTAADSELAALLHGSLRELLSGLPAGAALVCYTHLHRVAPDVSTVANDEKHYVALIYQQDAPTAWVSIGDARIVETLVSTAVGQIADSVGTAECDDTCLKQLGALLLDPLRPHIDQASHLVLAPIGTLWHVPFEALVLATGRPAIESWKRITFVSYPSEIRHWGSRCENENPPAVFGVSEYSKFCDVPTVMGFTDLPGALIEAKRVASILGVEPICNDDATKSRVAAVVRPSMLHLAAHAEYDADTDWKFESYFNMFLTMSSALRGPDYDAERRVVFSNPLFRSMIALAGANALLTANSQPAYGNGLLTAAEVELMDLRSTQLVVLSACKTVRGRAPTGPVRGLATAFAIAGAESLAVSLWDVDDRATQELMVSMYQRLLRGETLADALANTKLRIRKSFPRARNWAGFIVLGNPAALRGRGASVEAP
ncbi:CHAT domain-containing protein [Paraburkholderia guartelaensis]|nr:CHAT domain-containing protein [Paraburkholderia guartelaensis]